MSRVHRGWTASRRPEPTATERRLAFVAAMIGGKPMQEFKRGEWSVRLYQSVSGRGDVVCSAYKEPQCVANMRSFVAKDVPAAMKWVDTTCT